MISKGFYYGAIVGLIIVILSYVNVSVASQVANAILSVARGLTSTIWIIVPLIGGIIGQIFSR